MTAISIGDREGTAPKPPRPEQAETRMHGGADWPSLGGGNFDLKKDKQQSLDEVAAGRIPPMYIDDHDKKGFWPNLGIVANDLGTGAWHEITHNPLRLAESAALGLGIGLVASRLPFGVSLAGSIAGAAWTGGLLAENCPKWWHSADVVSNQWQYSSSEIAQAHAQLQDVGAGAADMTAGILGNGLTSIVNPSLASAFPATFGRGALLASTNEIVRDSVLNGTLISSVNRVSSAPIVTTVLGEGWLKGK